ncbi:MAG: YlxR family protein [Vulcanimicrobiaceae bacterium]
MGCRAVREQLALVRFVRTPEGWQGDPPGARRRPGRGAYLCSRECGARTAKNRKYPGLASAAAEYGFDRG